jgi:rhodanese-related sulfurtransferase
MTPEELIAAVEEGNPPVIVVIRSPRQFRDGHCSGAINISLSPIISFKLSMSLGNVS